MCNRRDNIERLCGQSLRREVEEKMIGRETKHAPLTELGPVLKVTSRKKLSTPPKVCMFSP